ncbi:hypothetical protein LBMAG18_08400 [Alphaproteobacteria bacterium]|nr:hypothetical protein LBMAG18_08400 [Alphaproteobacteria bacterium]
MATSQEILKLSQQSSSSQRLSALVDHRCDESNITAYAMQAGYFKNNQLQSLSLQGVTSLEQDGKAINEDTTFLVGSLTKMYTSASLLKLWDNELSEKKAYDLASDDPKKLPSDNFPVGIDTPLSHFMERLKTKFPESTYLSQIEKVDHYPKITLRDLLNHTHALGARDEEKIAKFQLKNPNQDFSCAQLVEFSKYNPQDKYGEFKYGNLGCELSGMIIELVTNKSYPKALKDLVLDQVEAKSSYIKFPSIKDSNTVKGYCYIATCQLEGEYYPGGEMNFNTSGNSLASGALITNYADADKFISKFLNKDLEKSLFANPEVIKSLYRDEGVDEKHRLCGVNKYPDGTFGHNGHSGSGEASLRFNPKTSETFFYCATGETLTYAVAYEILDIQRKDAGINKEISEDETIAKRNEMIKSGYDFLKIKKMHDDGLSFENIARTTIDSLAQKPQATMSFLERVMSFIKSKSQER